MQRVKKQAESQKKLGRCFFLTLLSQLRLPALGFPSHALLSFAIPLLLDTIHSLLALSLSPLKSDKACINLGPLSSCRWGPVHSYRECILLCCVMQRSFFRYLLRGDRISLFIVPVTGTDGLTGAVEIYC